MLQQKTKIGTNLESIILPTTHLIPIYIIPPTNVQARLLPDAMVHRKGINLYIAKLASHQNMGNSSILALHSLVLRELVAARLSKVQTNLTLVSQLTSRFHHSTRLKFNSLLMILQIFQFVCPYLSCLSHQSVFGQLVADLKPENQKQYQEQPAQT